MNAAQVGTPGVSTDPGPAPSLRRPDTRPGSRGLLRHAATPVVLALVLAALYWYVHGQPLDQFERRTLNRAYITRRVVEHIELTAYVTGLVLLIAVPLGVLLSRRSARRAVPVVLALGNLGQAVPSIGVLILLFLVLTDTGPATIAVIAFVAYAILPVLRNTMVGLRQVDASAIEAARGMGMTRLAVLWRVELPLAVPVILAGVRTALVISVGTVALATFIGAGGLGDIIESGITSFRNITLLTGAVLVAVLALLVDWIAGIAEELLRPRGL
ncbi:MAG TPA: ABC transporter permease [Mycobacteriales bacterium]|nr:ABC transporter permease [Mycobacteriales bacterium]